MAAPTDTDPVARIRAILTGPEVAQAIYVVNELGIADRLIEGPRTAEELAAGVDAKPQPLFRVMRTLASIGIFSQDSSDRFGLTPLSQVFRSDVPESIRALAIWLGREVYRAEGEMLHTVRTGESGFERAYGAKLFDYLAHNAEANHRFNAAMVARASEFEVLARAFDFSGRQKVVDVGGGKGQLLTKVLAANPKLKGVLFDQAHVVAEAPSLLQEAGILDRVEVVAGSVFDSIPSGADVYVESALLHGFPDEQARSILHSIRRAIEPDGTLLLFEFVLPPGITPSPGKIVDLRMLAVTGGRERSEREWRQLLESTGFELKRLIATGIPRSVIVAQPVGPTPGPAQAERSNGRPTSTPTPEPPRPAATEPRVAKGRRPPRSRAHRR